MIGTDFKDVCAIDGKMFEITGKVTITAGTTLKLLGITQEARVYLVNYFVRSSQGDLSIMLYENPTVTANGTPLTPINRNRNSSTTSKTLAFSNPTSSGGVDIYQSHVPDVGTGAHEQGGESEMPSLMVLKDNTPYTFEITNNALSDTTVSFSILWCEE